MGEVCLTVYQRALPLLAPTFRSRFGKTRLRVLNGTEAQ